MNDKKHSRKFDTIKSRYERGYVTIDQLRRYVELGAITPEEYEEISGEPYEDEEPEEE